MSAVTRQIAEALAHAHERGVIHGDLKPENILIEQRGPGVGRGADWVVKLTDFHLGRFSSGRGPSHDSNGLHQSLKTRGAVGTFHYMAPEQERTPGDVDGRADLFALGVCLFEMLTGHLPQGRDLPSDLNPAVSWWWDHIFSRCYTGVERRYGGADDLLEDLAAAGGGPRWGDLPSQRALKSRMAAASASSAVASVPAASDDAPAEVDREAAIDAQLDALEAALADEAGQARPARPLRPSLPPPSKPSALVLGLVLASLILPFMVLRAVRRTTKRPPRPQKQRMRVMPTQGSIAPAHVRAKDPQVRDLLRDMAYTQRELEVRGIGARRTEELVRELSELHREVRARGYEVERREMNGILYLTATGDGEMERQAAARTRAIAVGGRDGRMPSLRGK